MNYSERLIKQMENPEEAFKDLCSDSNGRLILKNEEFSCIVENPKRVTFILSESGDAIVEDIE